jgi:hypothetical protein
MANDSANLPRLDFTTFILSVSSAAYLGLSDENRNLELARQNIDLLELLWEKTQGNRTPDEERLLQTLLFETRMRFVEAQNVRRP